MKKLISLLGLLLGLTLLLPPEPALAYRGHGGFYGYGGFLPGLIIGGVLGWGLGPRYYYPPPIIIPRRRIIPPCP